jgi:gamma-glutamyltranspeptidase/glutathione hydrolase
MVRSISSHRNFIIAAILIPSLLISAVYSGAIDTSRHAMVVAAREEAVDAGLAIWQMGGNAVDSAVAAAFMIGVVEPYASGLGGGGAMLIYLKEQNTFHYIDYYVQGPARLDTAFSSKIHRETARSICVPGTPAGLSSAAKRFGKLPLKTAIQPAIETARRGFPVNDVFFNALLEKLELLLKYPETAAVYLNEGLPYMAGDSLKLPQMAQILDSIASQGEEYFYNGPFANQLIERIQQGGGYLDRQDLAEYQPIFSAPVSVSYRDYQIYSAAPPQSGITLLEILNLAELVPGDSWTSFEKSAEAVHWMAEVTKHADADRYAFLADPRFSEIPLQGLLSKQYARSRFSEITEGLSFPVNRQKIKAGNPLMYQKAEPEGPHTTHISVVDEQGNMVSLTQTLGFFFGSGVSVEGVLLNSGMTNFSSRGINRQEPGKRPRSTIAPTIIMRDGQPFAILGTPGGGTIFNVMAQVIVRLLDFGETPQRALDAPRFSVRVTAEQLTMEKRFDKSIVDRLEKLGYDLKLTPSYDVYMGGVHLIMVDSKKNFYIGVADPRRNGVAKGF